MLCRLCCLNKDTVSPIFDNDGTNFAAIIKSVLPSLSVFQNDSKPQHVCIECGDKLNFFNDFVQQCIDSECRFNCIEEIVNPQNVAESCKDEGDQVVTEISTSEWQEEKFIEKSVVEEPQYYFEFLIADDETPPPPQEGFVSLSSIDPEFVYQTIASGPCVAANESEEIQNEIESENTSQLIFNEVNIECPETAESDNVEELIVEIELPKTVKNCNKKKADKKKYECHVCGRIFTRQRRLMAHMILHSGIKPHKCDICQKGFGLSDELSKHLKIHRGDFTCEYCCRAFHSKAKLTRHERHHSGERPFRCPNCEKCFAEKVNMLKHVKLIHSVLEEERRPFLCSFCSAAFSDRSKLRDHFDRVHGGSSKRLECPAQGCTKLFKWRTNLNRHLKKCSFSSAVVPSEA